MIRSAISLLGLFVAVTVQKNLIVDTDLFSDVE
jgi:hypothetical protein